MTPFTPSLAALLLSAALGPALAQSPSAHGSHHHASEPAAATGALSEGEIIRWDPGTLKLTLRHGEIKPLGMPPMTMVFRVPDASMVGSLQPGDKVLFGVKRVNGVFQVTRLQAVP